MANPKYKLSDLDTAFSVIGKGIKSAGIPETKAKKSKTRGSSGGGGGRSGNPIVEELSQHGKKHRIKKAKSSHGVSVAVVARWIEFGTSKMPANPFMTRAFESKKQEMLDVFVNDLKEELGL